jgi:hypothetical protein
MAGARADPQFRLRELLHRALSGLDIFRIVFSGDP